MYLGETSAESNKISPVLLVHGLFQDGGCWIDSGVDAGLAYNLSAAGYDTWVGNTRGNLFSTKHVSLNTTEEKYWDYSVDEIGQYDVPAMIDYVLNVTSKEKLNYVGFSQGGTVGLMTFSEMPEYYSKVGLFIALAPAFTLGNATSVLKDILDTSASTVDVLKAAGIYSLFTSGSVYSEINTLLSELLQTSQITCRTIISALDSAHPNSITDEAYENICTHFPAPTGIKNLAGLGQIHKSGKFQKYDYGTEENLKMYGTALPPEYNMTAVRVPVVIIQGANDPIVNVTATRLLAAQLPNLKEIYVIDDPLWNHLDMSNSQYGKELLFPKINEYLLQHSGN